MHKKKRKHYLKHYFLKCFFFTIPERKFYNQLESILQKYNGRYRIFSKVRLWDIVDIPSNDIDKTFYQNKIARKHVDFVIVDKTQYYKPVLAIELNWASHKKWISKKSDELKEKILSEVWVKVLFFQNGTKKEEILFKLSEIL